MLGPRTATVLVRHCRVVMVVAGWSRTCSVGAVANPLQPLVLGIASTSRPYAGNSYLSHRALRMGGKRTGPVTRVVEAKAASQAGTSTAPAANNFAELGLSSELQTALQQLNITTPTEIQKLTVPALQTRGDYLMASHTGSGKTLAYLLPIVQQLKQEEKEAGFVPRPKRPRAVILGPTKELTEQIATVAKALSHHVKLRVVCSNASNQSRATLDAKLSGPVDIVVASPTKLLQHVKDGNLYYRDVRWLVVDEADTIFAEGWGEELGQVLGPLRAKADPASVVLVSATMTKPIKRLLSSQFPAIKSLQTSSVHHGIAGSKHYFVSLPPGRDKLDMLVEVLGADARRGQKVLVFCNGIDSCRAVEHTCRERGLKTTCYHGDMPVLMRAESMKLFAGAMPPGEEGGHPIMIATDLAARGLDFPGRVDHVVNFDFPFTAVDYIHRSGRTARAGHTGKITSIVSGRDKVLAQRIEYALEHGEPLDQLSADPDVLPPSQRQRQGSAATAASRGGRQGTRQAGGSGRGRSAGPGSSGASRSQQQGSGRSSRSPDGGRQSSRGGSSGGYGAKSGGRGGGRSAGAPSSRPSGPPSSARGSRDSGRRPARAGR